MSKESLSFDKRRVKKWQEEPQFPDENIELLMATKVLDLAPLNHGKLVSIIENFSRVFPTFAIQKDANSYLDCVWHEIHTICEENIKRIFADVTIWGRESYGKCNVLDFGLSLQKKLNTATIFVSGFLDETSVASSGVALITDAFQPYRYLWSRFEPLMLSIERTRGIWAVPAEYQTALLQQSKVTESVISKGAAERTCALWKLWRSEFDCKEILGENVCEEGGSLGQDGFTKERFQIIIMNREKLHSSIVWLSQRLLFCTKQACVDSLIFSACSEIHSRYQMCLQNELFHIAMRNRTKRTNVSGKFATGYMEQHLPNLEALVSVFCTRSDNKALDEKLITDAFAPHRDLWIRFSPGVTKAIQQPLPSHTFDVILGFDMTLKDSVRLPDIVTDYQIALSEQDKKAEMAILSGISESARKVLGLWKYSEEYGTIVGDDYLESSDGNISDEEK